MTRFFLFLFLSLSHFTISAVLQDLLVIKQKISEKGKRDLFINRFIYFHSLYITCIISLSIAKILPRLLNILPFAGQDILQSCSRNQMIVALEPLIPLLPDKGGIMSSFQRALVIYYSKEGIPIVSDRINPTLFIQGHTIHFYEKNIESGEKIYELFRDKKRRIQL